MPAATIANDVLDVNLAALKLARQSGDRAAADVALRMILKSAIVKWAINHARTPWAKWLEHEDAAQVAASAIWEAARTYDPSRPASPYLQRVARSRILNAGKVAKRSHERPGTLHWHTRSYSDPQCFHHGTRNGNEGTADDVMHDEADEENPDKTAVEIDARARQRLARRLIPLLRRRLSRRELIALVSAEAYGRTYAQQAAREGVSVKAIDNDLKRGRDKLREYVARITADAPDLDVEEQAARLIRLLSQRPKPARVGR